MAEATAIERLIAAQQQLLLDEGRLDMKSEAGYAACAAMLASLEAAAQVLGLETAPRSYRARFSANYQALFPDEERHYRVDVLEASADQDPAIWVNGDKFEFSADATCHAQQLQHAWSALCMHLDLWEQSASRLELRPSQRDLAACLDTLDHAWADFEQQYICELIAIESKARRLIVQAVEQERKLQLLEQSLRPVASRHVLSEIPEYRQEQTRLVACIARLNAVANVTRKGRDDLGVEILESANAALRRCDAGELGGRGAGSSCARYACGAARVLAQDVVGSFAAMRSYLQKVARCLERVDPHLCNNQGLVTRLVDWEESWEVGSRYVLRPAMLDAVCDLIAEVRAAQQLAPALASMCEDCDVELFLVLPRIIVLCFAAEPGASRRELVRTLLPHRFAGQEPCRELLELAASAGRALPALSSLRP
eukprot:CAMPEP_0168384614 /NCGR_PEP_ID=MMETSP0228-20121227/14501_1 /TAXON_ID=133427 /ORGANISM="Protoceratium reticulatum, Strain CCCM 535 (=CCMP 1889)" /LENGTH=425 /DNA_ID=CAMNT_0008397785 /DNA_START=57 /DNA_END=1331 /DNA_ORIENTATION=+